jgi:hypothetical protein
VQRVGLGELAGYRAGDRGGQAIEDPGGAEPENQAGMERRPALQQYCDQLSQDERNELETLRRWKKGAERKKSKNRQDAAHRNRKRQ